MPPEITGSEPLAKQPVGNNAWSGDEIAMYVHGLNNLQRRSEAMRDISDLLWKLKPQIKKALKRGVQVIDLYDLFSHSPPVSEHPYGTFARALRDFRRANRMRPAYKPRKPKKQAESKAPASPPVIESSQQKFPDTPERIASQPLAQEAKQDNKSPLDGNQNMDPAMERLFREKFTFPAPKPGERQISLDDQRREHMRQREAEIAARSAAEEEKNRWPKTS